MMLTLPMPPNVANARGHWRTRYSAIQHWKMLALVQEKQLRGCRPFPTKVRIGATFYVGKHPKWMMDEDNCTARLKTVLDFLREMELLVNDDPAHVTLDKPTQQVGSPRRVVLTLEPVAQNGAIS